MIPCPTCPAEVVCPDLMQSDEAVTCPDPITCPVCHKVARTGRKQRGEADYIIHPCPTLSCPVCPTVMPGCPTTKPFSCPTCAPVKTCPRPRKCKHCKVKTCAPCPQCSQLLQNWQREWHYARYTSQEWYRSLSVCYRKLTTMANRRSIILNRYNRLINTYNSDTENLRYVANKYRDERTLCRNTNKNLSRPRRHVLNNSTHLGQVQPEEECPKCENCKPKEGNMFALGLLAGIIFTSLACCIVIVCTTYQ